MSLYNVTFSSAHEKVDAWIEAVPKPKFPPEPGEKNGRGVPNRFRRRTFHVLNWRYLVRLMKRSASELGLRMLNRLSGAIQGLGATLVTGRRTFQSDRAVKLSGLPLMRFYTRLGFSTNRAGLTGTLTSRSFLETSKLVSYIWEIYGGIENNFMLVLRPWQRQ